MLRSPFALQQAGAQPNPSRTVWIAGAVGTGLVLAAGAWLIWGRKPGAADLPKGQVICASPPYFGPVDVGDYVVVALGSAQGDTVESTWARVTARQGSTITATLVGESSEGGGDPKPLSTSQHGFTLGDSITIERKCISDRFRPGQTWRTVCGPSLIATGHHAISPAQASLLGVGDRAQILIHNESGETAPLWVLIDNVSQGVQTLRGQVNLVPSETLGPSPGDVIEFLRDCVIDAEFAGPILQGSKV